MINVQSHIGKTDTELSLFISVWAFIAAAGSASCLLPRIDQRH